MVKLKKILPLFALVLPLFIQANVIFPPTDYKIQGQYVTVENQKVWTEQYGSGSPAIILINGAGDSIRAWNAVIPKLAKITTVVGFDRPGLGQSGTLTNLHSPRTAKESAEILQGVIQQLHLKGPFVLMAHSIGGLYLSYFASNHPQEIAGLITLDGNTVTQVFWNKLNFAGLPADSKQKAQLFMQEQAERTASLQEQNQQLLAQKELSLADEQQIVSNLEILGKPQNVLEIERSPPLPAVPLIALTEGTDATYDLWHASIEQFAAQVPCSIYFVVPNSGHYIQIDQPQYVIVAAQTMVSRIREHKNLCNFKIMWPSNS